MAQTEKPHARSPSTDHRTWSWKRLFGKDGKDDTYSNPLAPASEDEQRPGIVRRLSRKVVPELPRAPTFKRQQSELRDRLEPTNTISGPTSKSLMSTFSDRRGVTTEIERTRIPRNDRDNPECAG
jgi:hypothetical protein